MSKQLDMLENQPLSLRVDDAVANEVNSQATYKALLLEQQAEIRRLRGLLEGCTEVLLKRERLEP